MKKIFKVDMLREKKGGKGLEKSSVINLMNWIEIF